MQIEELLVHIGLSKKEIQLYLFLLTYTHLSATEIADKLNMKRPTVYYVLEGLEEKGLVHGIGAKVARYRAESPEQLEQILIRRQKELGTLRHILKKQLPSFPILSSVHEGKDSDVAYFRGKDALFNLMQKVYDAREKKVYALNPPFEKIVGVLDVNYGLHYLKKRAALGIQTYSIWQDMPEDRRISDHDAFGREVRLAPVSLVGHFESGIEIFDNTVIILNFLPELFGIAIESHAYAVTMKALWQQIWNQATPINGTRCK